MENILEKNNSFAPPKVGDVVKGKIVQKGKSSLFLDLGNFKMGIIYGREFIYAKDFLKNLKIGDEITGKIIELENDDGYVELSVQKANEDIVWRDLKSKKENGENIGVKILGVNKGGLVAKVFSLPAFMPLSQVSSEHYSGFEGQEVSKIIRELQKLVGQELKVRILSLDQRNRTVMLSEKLGQLDELKNILKNYKSGQEVEGEITALTNFGAFLKFGKENLDGLIYSSEIDNPEILKINQKIKAKIIKISDNRVYLSLKDSQKVSGDSTAEPQINSKL